MSLPDNCPLCCAHVLVEWDGKRRKSERSATFECQTSIYAGQDPRQTQSRWCEVRERQYLAARVAELEARCKRLEEAVESLLPYAEATDDESSEWGPGRWKSEKLKRIIDEARKAKEAKP